MLIRRVPPAGVGGTFVILVGPHGRFHGVKGIPVLTNSDAIVYTKIKIIKKVDINGLKVKFITYCHTTDVHVSVEYTSKTILELFLAKITEKSGDVSTYNTAVWRKTLLYLFNLNTDDMKMVRLKWNMF